MKLIWTVGVNKPCWVGGDYNGSWSSHTNWKKFSTEEKAKLFIKNYKDPEKYVIHEPQFFGPFKEKLDE